MHKPLPLIFLLFLSVPLCCGTYYADVRIDISESGQVSFSGNTNSPLLQGDTNNLTSKDGSYWVLNITSEEVFNDYIFELNLPRNAVVNYIKTSSISRIEEGGAGLRIIGTGRDKRFLLIVQYKIDSVKKGLPWLILLLPVAGVLGIFVLRRTGPKIDKSKLTERQKQIILVLERNRGKATQKRIQKVTGIPKASLSRNTDTLQKMGIIEKTDQGLTTLISLKK